MYSVPLYVCPVNVDSALTGGRFLTTTGVRWLALAILAPRQQPGSTYAIHLRVLGFSGVQGGDNPPQSQPVKENTLIHIQKLVTVAKTNGY